MRALLLFALFVAIEASAGTRETTISGIVVDSRGRPIPRALVSYMSRRTDRLVVGTDIQAGRDGRFEFTESEPISDLMVRADSPDLKQSGRLDHITSKGNVVVVR